MALNKSKVIASGVSYVGISAHWGTDVGHCIVVAENIHALNDICQRIEPGSFDPSMCVEVVVHRASDTKADQ